MVKSLLVSGCIMFLFPLMLQAEIAYIIPALERVRRSGGV